MPATGTQFQQNKALNNSIMAFAAKNDGNTSIMDIASGFKQKKKKN